jgi:hypothetical protein
MLQKKNGAQKRGSRFSLGFFGRAALYKIHRRIPVGGKNRNHAKK